MLEYRCFVHTCSFTAHLGILFSFNGGMLQLPKQASINDLTCLSSSVIIFTPTEC